MTAMHAYVIPSDDLMIDDADDDDVAQPLYRTIPLSQTGLLVAIATAPHPSSFGTHEAE